MSILLRESVIVAAGAIKREEDKEEMYIYIPFSSLDLNDRCKVSKSKLFLEFTDGIQIIHICPK